MAASAPPSLPFPAIAPTTSPKAESADSVAPSSSAAASGSESRKRPSRADQMREQFTKTPRLLTSHLGFVVGAAATALLRSRPWAAISLVVGTRVVYEFASRRAEATMAQIPDSDLPELGMMHRNTTRRTLDILHETINWSHLASFSLYYGGGALVTFTVIRLGVTLPGSIMRQRADGLTRSAVGILAAERPTAPLDRGER